jgi:hypothetical protein
VRYRLNRRIPRTASTTQGPSAKIKIAAYDTRDIPVGPLTISLSGRPPTCPGRRGRTIFPSARGANPLTFHGRSKRWLADPSHVIRPSGTEVFVRTFRDYEAGRAIVP